MKTPTSRRRRSRHPTQPGVATVYTNVPKRRREAIFANLCTLLCPHRPLVRPRGATVYTNAPKRRREAIFANLCTLLRPHRPLARPPRRNSVHKCPRTAPRGHFRQSVYTPAPPRPLAQPGGATGSTTSTAPWPRDARTLGPDAHVRRRGGDATSYPHELTKPLT